MFTALLLAAAAPAPTAAFDPLRFFTGTTRGEGRLKVVLRAGVTVTVRGSGRVEPGGTLVLDQRIVEGAKPPRTRRWRLRRVSPLLYQGTLTDARGPVTGRVEGPVLTLAYRTPSGFRITQRLTLAANGRSAANRLEARRLGLRVATLTETIVKIR